MYLSAPIIHSRVLSFPHILSLSLSATSPIFLSPLFTPCGIPETALSNALNYTHHWFPEQRIGAGRAIVFSSFLLSDLAACSPPLPEQRVNKNRQMRGNSTWHSTEVWVWLTAQGICVVWEACWTSNCNQKASWESNPLCSNRDILWWIPYMYNCLKHLVASSPKRERCYSRVTFVFVFSSLLQHPLCTICLVLLITAYSVA